MEKVEEKSLLPEIGKSFFINDSEYKVTFINDEKCRFAADPNLDVVGKIPLSIGNKFMIESNSYIVTYVHSTKKRITAKPLSIGY